MAAYCAASSSWRKAKPTVRNSAKISNPSKVQPRFEAISTFHCARLSERYHGNGRTDSCVDIEAPSPVHPRLSHAREAIGQVSGQSMQNNWRGGYIPSPHCGRRLPPPRTLHKTIRSEGTVPPPRSGGGGEQSEPEGAERG